MVKAVQGGQLVEKRRARCRQRSLRVRVQLCVTLDVHNRHAMAFEATLD